MGYRHSSDEILEAALDAAIDDGLSQLTYGRLARRLEISDRIIVYYFPTKDDLTTAVLMTLGSRIQDVLADVFTEPETDHIQLARTAWPRLAQAHIDPIFGVFFEMNGLAAAGREPYKSLATQLVASWTNWLAEFVTGTKTHRRTEAEAAIALLDGLLLLRQLAGPEPAARAAKRLGLA